MLDENLDTTAHDNDNIIPDGLSIEHDQVDPELWANIRHWLSSDTLPSSAAVSNDAKQLLMCKIPWETGPQMQGRRIAQFGNCKYDYTSDVAQYCKVSTTINGHDDDEDDGCAPPIPNYIRQTLLKNCQNNSESEQYTQCIINMYNAENEIPWHLDHEYFGPKVLVYTFGEDRPFMLRRKVLNKEEVAIANAKENQKEADNSKYTYATVFPRHGSKYFLSGEARDIWEHSVPSGKSERISITFRSWIGIGPK